MLPIIHPASISVGSNGAVEVSHEHLAQFLSNAGMIQPMLDPPNGGCHNTGGCTGDNTACGNVGCG